MWAYLNQEANQTTGSQKVTQMSYTNTSMNGVVLNMNLTSGQTYLISDYCENADIIVRTSDVFDYSAITDQFSNEVERQYEDGPHIYFFPRASIV